jgi:tetratricopeptide (TPR) repeat protein
MSSPIQPNLPFSKLGISLKGIQDFIDRCGEEQLENLTTEDVSNGFIKPHTEVTQQSYCEMIEDPGSSFVGEADVFVSHAWKYKFLDVVSTLQEHFAQTPDILIWFDLFSNNQHAETLTIDWWMGTFRTAIAQFGRVVMVLSPWDNPIPLRRAWCLYEIYCAVEEKGTFEVVMNADASVAFLENVVADPDTYLTMLSNIDLGKSESKYPADKDLILDVVNKTVGIYAVNSLVASRMRDWVRAELVKSIDEYGLSEYSRVTRRLALGEVLLAQGEFGAAETHFESCIGVANVDPIVLAKAQHGLGNAFRGLGRYSDAIDVHERALQNFGRDNADVARCYNNLAMVYSDKGCYAEALEMHEKALQMQISVLGDSHSDVATSLCNMAEVHTRLNNHEKALEALEKALTIQLSVLGDNHIHVFTTYNNIAEVYIYQGFLDKALQLQIRVLDALLSVWGDSHPNVAAAYNNLAHIYSDGGHSDKALDAYKKALLASGCRDVSACKDIAAARYCCNMATVYSDLRRYDEAIRAYEKALQIRLSAFGESHRDVAIVYNNMAHAYSELGHYERALEMNKKALQIQVAFFGEHHSNVATLHNNMAAIYRKLGDFDKALEFHEKSLHIFESLFGSDHPSVARVTYNIGLVYSNRGSDDNQAVALFEKALAIQVAVFEETHPHVVATESELAIVKNRLRL